MGLLQTLGTGQGYLKAGFLGFPKSGKTFTAVELAIGTRDFFKLTGPIAMFDTEGGSEYVADTIQARTGLALMGVRSRSFDDLVTVAREAEKAGVSVLVVDSMTHVWRELCDAYLKRVNEIRKAKNASAAPRTSLEFQDWNPIKAKFNVWTDWYLNSPMHVVICGRAGYDYDYQEKDGGGRELVKTGVKMKTETEFGFEPSLLVEMERIQERNGKTEIVHRATVIGDRFNVIDGKQADNPTVAFFLPYLSRLTPGVHAPIDVDVKSEAGLTTEGDGEWSHEKRQRVILAEEIQGELLRAWPSTTKEEKTAKAEAIFKAFGTRSWTKVESLPSETLRSGLVMVKTDVAAALGLPVAEMDPQTGQAVADLSETFGGAA